MPDQVPKKPINPIALALFGASDMMRSFNLSTLNAEQRKKFAELHKFVETLGTNIGDGQSRSGG